MTAFIRDLKSKLTDIDGRLEEISKEATELVTQKAAIEKVISLYEPDFVPLLIETPKPKVIEGFKPIASKGSATSRVTEIMRDFSNVELAYEMLGKLGKPCTSSEVAKAFAKETKIEDEWGTIGEALTSRFSAAFNRLKKGGKVRIKESVRGRKHTWEIVKKPSSV